MLKQFSVPGKIFCTTTVLFILCYVGVFFHIHRAHAVPDWVSYVAKVSNIQLNPDTGKHTVYTEHRLQYDNDTSSTAQKKIRGKAIWHRKNPDDADHIIRRIWVTSRDTPFDMKTHGVYWFATIRSHTLNLIDGKDYRGAAYTNVIEGDWPSTGVGAATVETAWFKKPEFAPFVTPAVPVEEEKP